jgi:enoyl-CoA hydratase/carnithine racemase
MADVEIELHDNVGILKLNKGVTNPLDLGFLNEILNKLNELENDPNVNSLILTSTNNKFFSIGFNLPVLIEQTREEVISFYTTFNRLCIEIYTFPKPTLAVITGHAVAGGCILTLCCDHRFIAEGHKLMGLNEVKLGVPIPYPGACMLQQIVGIREASKIMEVGDFVEPTDSLKIGLVDEIIILKELLPRSIEVAKRMGELPNDVLNQIKSNRTQLVDDMVQTFLSEKEHKFIECWYTDDTQGRLREAAKKF